MGQLSELLARYVPFDEKDEIFKRQLEQFLSVPQGHYSRENMVGHVVADGWVVNKRRDKVLLIEHAAGGRWMAPGGHCDGDSDVYAAALREVWEETGLKDVKPLLGGEIYDINTGTVPLRKKSWGMEPPHVHFDVCFAFEADENVPLKISEESTGLAWVEIEKIGELNFFPEHYRRVEKLKQGRLG